MCRLQPEERGQDYGTRRQGRSTFARVAFLSCSSGIVLTLARLVQIFERPSTIIVGLDRLILQTVGFDFRVRHPQKLLVKMIRRLVPPEDAKEFLAVAYPMSIDLYKTFAPIKQTSFTMALGVIELTALILGKHVDAIRALDAEAFHTSRGCVVETLLDLLDLYTQFPKSTKIGPRFKLERFIEIKIRINEEVDAGPHLRRIESWCDICAAEERDTHPITPKSATSPATAGSGPGGSIAKTTSQKRQETTMRFVFSDDAMRHEQAEMAKYFAEEYEEFEVEVEEQVPEPNPNSHGGHVSSHNGHSHNGHSHMNHNNHISNNTRGHGSRRDRSHSSRNHQGGSNSNGGNNNSDPGWGPYHRNRNSDHPRHKPRKGGYYQ